MTRNLFVALVLLTSASDSFAQNIPLDPAIRTGKLSNGFTYYIRKNTEPVKRAQLYLAVKAGSVLETEEQRGLAHFVEHMSFNGTRNFPKNEIVNYLQRAGVRFGADLNAYTSFDETVYQLPIPTDSFHLLSKGLQIVRDWAQDATLDPVEIDKERGVVLEEKRLRKGVQDRVQDILMPLMYNNSRYNQRLPIGTEEVLNNFTPATIRSFYTNWYRPDLQAIFVVGDVDVDAVEKIIREKFSDLKNPSAELLKPEYKIPLTGKNQFKVITDHELPQRLVNIIIKHPEQIVKTEKDFRIAMVKNLWNQLFNTRFYEVSQVAGTPIAQVVGQIAPLAGDLEAINIQAVPRQGDMGNFFRQLWSEMQRIKQSGFTTAELNRIKTGYRNMLQSMLEQKNNITSEVLVKNYLSHFLKGAAIASMEDDIARAEKCLDEIQAEEINALGAEYLKNVDRDIYILAPESAKDSLPTESAVNEWIAGIEKEKLAKYIDEEANATLMKTEPAAGRIINEKKIKKTGVTELLLSNGARVVLKPTDYKKNEIIINAHSHGGLSLYENKDLLSASFAGSIVNGSGLGDAGPVTLSKILTGKMAQVGPYISEEAEGFSGYSTTKDVKTALQLLHLYFTAPRKDSVVFNNMMSDLKTNIVNRLNVPEEVLADTMNAVMSGYNARTRALTTERLNELDLDKAFNIYKQRFNSAADFTFFFTGDFNIDSLKPLLEKYIGSLPASGVRETYKDRGIRTPLGKISKTVYAGKEDKATVKMIFSGNFKWSEENQLLLSAIKNIVQYRITERLREKEGGAYSPATGVSVSKFPVQQYFLSITFGCAPANIEKLIEAAREELDAIVKNGPSDEDITRFVAEQGRQYELNLRDNGFWSSHLLSKYSFNEDPASVFSFPATLKSMTKQNIHRAAKIFLDQTNYMRFVLTPQAK